TALGLEADAFERTLAQHRAFVEQTFRNAFRLAGMGDADDHPAPSSKPTHATSSCAHDHEHDAESLLAEQIKQAFGDEADDLLRRTESLLNSLRIRSLPESSRRRLDALLPAAIEAAQQTSAPQQAAVRLFDLIETIAQR